MASVSPDASPARSASSDAAHIGDTLLRRPWIPGQDLGPIGFYPLRVFLPRVAGAQTPVLNSGAVGSYNPGAEVLGTVDHGGERAAIVGSERLLGVQFHPERSGSAGLALLRTFAAAVGALDAEVALP